MSDREVLRRACHSCPIVLGTLGVLLGLAPAPSLGSSFTAPVFDGPGNQIVLGAVPDSDRGAIVVWATPDASPNELRAQRVSRDGASSWPAGGVRIPTPHNDDYYHVAWISSDGLGGAMIVWQQFVSEASWPNFSVSTLRAQRIDSAGQVLWDTLGVPLCTAAQTKYSVGFVPDGSGGGTFAWMDHRNGEPVSANAWYGQWRSGFDVFAQRVNAGGATSWGPAGRAVRDTTSWGGVEDILFDNEPSLDMVSDGLGGVLLAWPDRRDIRVRGRDIYAQRLDPSGTPLWARNGVPVYADSNWSQVFPRLAGDGHGGAVVVWLDERGPGYFHLHAQEIDGSGVPQWDPRGVLLSSEATWDWSPTLITDRNGGAFIAWGSSAAFMQHLDRNGNPTWPPQGIRLADTYHRDGRQRDGGVPLLTDGGEGVFCVLAAGSGSSFSLRAQHVNAHGTLLWGQGVPLPAWPSASESRPHLVPSGAGMFVFWSYADVYGTYVGRSGFASLADVSNPSFGATAAITPNPVRTSADLSITVGTAGRVRALILDPEGRVVRHLMNADQPAGWRRLAFDGRDDQGAALRSGIYFLRVQSRDGQSSKAFVVLR